MLTSLSFRRSLVALALATPLTLHAQETQLFTWSGRVDREVRLTMSGNQLTNSSEQNMQTRGRFSDRGAMPRMDGSVRVVTNTGRGSVSVIQQPNSQNGYTTIIDLVDNDGGADNYRVTAYFTPNTARGYGDRGRGADRNRDGIPDRNERPMGRGDDRNRDGISDRVENGNARGRGPMLRWSGDVDGAIELVWRANGVSPRIMNGAAPRVQNSTVTGTVTSTQYGQLSVNVREGRGQVEVVQQPSAQNRYTGVIRIIDPQGGYGHYSIEATWQ